MKSIRHLALLGFALSLYGQACFAASQFSLPWMNNEQAEKTYESAAHPDGIFVVEAFFLGCPHCNNNAPAVNALAASYASNPRVQVLDVGIDKSDESYQEWIRRNHPNHPVLKDAQRKLIGQLGTTGYPSTYVLDCKGNVITSTSGEMSSSSKARLKAAIDKLAKTTCANDDDSVDYPQD